MIELEKTYLVKEVPKNLTACPSKEIIDLYVPRSQHHPKLRIRKNGNKFEITKKEPLEEDASEQEEQTIILTEEEFYSLVEVEGKKTHKIRYNYDYNGRTAEFDVFQGPLKGLILVDFEFDSVEDKNSFQMPDFCLRDVTHEEFIAGGMVCGKSYEDIQENLNKFSYKRLEI
jgi:CYTH domain-containing protein